MYLSSEHAQSRVAAGGVNAGAPQVDRGYSKDRMSDVADFVLVLFHSGTIAHILLEEAPDDLKRNTEDNKSALLGSVPF